MATDPELYADFLRCTGCTKLSSVGRLLDVGVLACPRCGSGRFAEPATNIRTGEPVLTEAEKQFIKKELEKWVPHRVQ